MTREIYDVAPKGGPVEYVKRMSLTGAWLASAPWMPAKISVSSWVITLAVNLVGWVVMVPFLVWTAEPKLERRHATGIAVAIFLLFATVFAYLSYQNIWREQKHPKVRETGALEPENQAKTGRAKRKAGVKG